MKALWFVTGVITAASLSGAITPGKAQTSKQPTGEFLVRVVETEIDQSINGVTATDCLLVQADGRFHIERRFQRLPTPSATGKFYDGKFNDAQMDEINRVLENRAVIGLPEYKYRPPSGASVYRIHAFVVEIPRDTQVQNAGFARWMARDTHDSFDSAPVEARSSYERAKRALQPLQEWFHQVEAAQTKPIDEDSNFCEVQ